MHALRSAELRQQPNTLLLQTLYLPVLSMKLKNIHLIYSVKMPWSTNFSEYIDPKDDYSCEIVGDLLHILKAGTTINIVHASLIRYADVIPEADVTTPSIRLGLPMPLAIVEEPPAASPKRAGRPPRISL
jgi:hypothetical protein